MTTQYNRQKYHRIYYRKNRDFILNRAKTKAMRMKYKAKFNLHVYVQKKKDELIKNDAIIISFN